MQGGKLESHLMKRFLGFQSDKGCSELFADQMYCGLRLISNGMLERRRDPMMVWGFIALARRFRALAKPLYFLIARLGRNQFTGDGDMCSVISFRPAQKRSGSQSSIGFSSTVVVNQRENISFNLFLFLYFFLTFLPLTSRLPLFQFLPEC